MRLPANSHRPSFQHADRGDDVPRLHACAWRTFTLIELGVVLLLAALMLAIIAPRAGRIPRALAVRSLIGTVESAFRDAGLRARASGSSVRLRADPSANCLRIDRSSPSANPAAPDDSPSTPKTNTPNVRRKYEFPANTEWRTEQGLPHAESFDEEAAEYIFHPGGEASGPDLEITLRKQTFRISVDRLTGRPVVSNVTNPK